MHTLRFSYLSVIYFSSPGSSVGEGTQMLLPDRQSITQRKDAYHPINEIHGMHERSHSPYADPYKPRNTPEELPHGSSRPFTEIAPLIHPGRLGQPVRLAKAEHRVDMGAGHAILPGQLCVAVESLGIGQGSRFDGIHAARARLPSESERRMHAARVQIVPGGQYRPM
jgi:hypothetical protein